MLSAGIPARAWKAVRNRVRPDLRSGETVLAKGRILRLRVRDPQQRMSLRERIAWELSWSTGHAWLTDQRFTYRVHGGSLFWPFAGKAVGGTEFELSDVVHVELERHWWWRMIMRFELRDQQWVAFEGTSIKNWKQALDALGERYDPFANLALV